MRRLAPGRGPHPERAAAALRRLAAGRARDGIDPYARRILINVVHSAGRRRWLHERPTPDLPEQSAPADQTEPSH
ncbi:hypothetical protein [Longispora fulva]|uniref:DNA-directed RNA polymerase specialized sigma24 family protein n=1 Tax=Longispora fulva TaxID=619741 RepID=A0A8J7KDC0_9ACTN|nr:hypothetical protein [Longispora fulva]MBG6133890.1 DNA-directed RNA polymerase specialized sigma24 family protein [Longispora fulva]